MEGGDKGEGRKQRRLIFVGAVVNNGSRLVGGANRPFLTCILMKSKAMDV